MSDNRSNTPKEHRDSWATPQWLFNWLDSLFDFDIDLAASYNNLKCEVFLTDVEDALNTPWFGYSKLYGYIERRGFLNPPYSKVGPWVEKAIAEALLGFTTVMVIPTPNGESYYSDIFEHAFEIMYITGRVSFIDHNGKPKSGNTRGTCVVVFNKLGGVPRLSHYNRDDLILEFG